MIPYFIPYLDEKEEKAVANQVKTGWLTHGNKCETFESMFGELEGSKYNLYVSSATIGLYLALLALNIKEGDEVITSPYTYCATWQAIQYTGATPVFVDINEDDLNINPNLIASKITANTKAILPIHMTGKLCDMKMLKQFNLPIIEDSAHRAPQPYRNKGDFRVYSFYANKLLTTGEGGMICFDNPKYLEPLVNLIYHGRTDYRKTTNKGLTPSNFGYKFNNTDLNAVIGIEQLKKLDSKMIYHKRIADYYNKFHFNSVREGHHHIYPIWFDTQEELKSFKQTLNCETSLHYPIKVECDCPISKDRSKKTISLPIYPHLNIMEVFK